MRMISARTITGSAEIPMTRIKNLAQEQGARCVFALPLAF